MPSQAGDVSGKDPKGVALVHVDKLISRAGLAASRTEAARKLKEGAVKIDGELVSSPVVSLKDLEFVLQVGRKMKSVSISYL